MTIKTFIQQPRRPGKATAATIDQLIDAYQRARLHGPVEKVLANHNLSICLKNIVASNQADPNRHYDLFADGNTVFIKNISPPTTPITTPKADRMRLASGETDED